MLRTYSLLKSPVWREYKVDPWLPRNYHEKSERISGSHQHGGGENRY